MVFHRRMLWLVLLGAALWIVPGCQEAPAPAEDVTAGTEEESPVPEPVSGDAEEVLGEAADDLVAVLHGLPEPAPGQWVSFEVVPENLQITAAILRSEDHLGVSCLWYQFSGQDVVFQVLMDPAVLQMVRSDMETLVAEMGSDPAAWIAENLSADNPSGLMMPDNDPTRMVAFIRAIRMIRFRSDDQIIALDMSGVAEMVEQMLLQNPDLLEQQGGMAPDADFQTFSQKLQEARFQMEYTTLALAGTQLGCLLFSVNHPETGEMKLAFSGEIPIIPLAMLSVSPPAGEGTEPVLIQVSGFGFDGVEDLMPGPAETTIPAAMMLQGLMQ